MQDTTTTTDALELLMSQHAHIESQLDDLEYAFDAAQKADQLRRLADSIAAHMAIEERLFYPSVMDESTRASLMELTEEHLSIKRVLADLLTVDPADERFDAKLAVLAEQFLHHAREEEEEELFPRVRSLLDDGELAVLGNELLVMYEELMAQEPRRYLPMETQVAAALP
jgi:hemerythrin superfamily protein